MEFIHETLQEGLPHPDDMYKPHSVLGFSHLPLTEIFVLAVTAEPHGIYY